MGGETRRVTEGANGGRRELEREAEMRLPPWTGGTRGTVLGPESSAAILWNSSLDLDNTSVKMVGDTFRGYLNVTDIDSYRKCPMRFYIERVLNLEREDPRGVPGFGAVSDQ